MKKFVVYNKRTKQVKYVSDKEPIISGQVEVKEINITKANLNKLLSGHKVYYDKGLKFEEIVVNKRKKTMEQIKSQFKAATTPDEKFKTIETLLDNL